MKPILFQWGQFYLQGYSLMMCLGFIAAVVLWLKINNQKWSETTLVKIALICLVAGLIGARAFFIVLQWPFYESGYFRWWALWEGGVVFYGGAILGALCLIGLFKFYKIPVWQGLNSAVAPMALGHAFGRIGCFLNGCCHGATCDFFWCLSVSDPISPTQPKGVPLHPSALYEAFGLFCLSFILFWAYKNPKKLPIQTVTLYVVAYGLLRFGVELSRGDGMRGTVFGFSTSQFISMLLIPSVLFLDFIVFRGHKRGHES